MAVTPIVPDERLRSAADFVRQGAYFADIGTDHAYLPVFLLESGRIAAAYASDVAEGPVAHAREVLRLHGLSDSVILRKADGLSGLFAAFPLVSDIAICGMGGELIAKLIDEEPAVRDPKLHLILQPMSRPGHLRRYLAENGFLIEKEALSRAQGRIYSCLSVVYTGIPYELSLLSAEIGAYHIETTRNDPKLHSLFTEYVTARRAVEEEKRAGLLRGGCDTSESDRLIDALSSLV